MWKRPRRGARQLKPTGHGQRGSRSPLLLWSLALALSMVGLFVLMLVATGTHAAPPAEVDLILFQGAWEDDGVHLVWITGSEENHMAFYLYRYTDTLPLEDVYFEADLVEYFPAFSACQPVSGNTYTYVDTDVDPAEGVYHYWLESIDCNGEGSIGGDAYIVVQWRGGGDTTPTASPTPGASATATATSTSTPTPSPSVSPTPTPSPSPIITNTMTPTPTETPALTPTPTSTQASTVTPTSPASPESATPTPTSTPTVLPSSPTPTLIVPPTRTPPASAPTASATLPPLAVVPTRPSLLEAPLTATLLVEPPSLLVAESPRTDWVALVGNLLLAAFVAAWGGLLVLWIRVWRGEGKDV
ncbi:hypothetical protein [Ardenticatena maritima]|uniref:hypothetical protein n=1 Tax=Ardenticatena maritima TaxID=872965 RepID=UPI000A538F08|nr:hypothetical protein [Ardenticatena maritima]